MAYLILEDGRKLFYEIEGAGRPVIMIHGWKANANVFAQPSKLLNELGDYCCIRYDQCGHTRSDPLAQPVTLATLAQDLHQLIRQLGLERPALVGWSMGGMTILEYVRRYGCRELDRVVLVDIGPKAQNMDPAALSRELALQRESFHEFMRGYYMGKIPGFSKMSAREQDSIITTRMVGQDPATLTCLWESMRLRDHCDVIPQLHCPTAVFHAQVMPSCPEEVARYYMAHLPGPKKKVCFQGATHSLISEQPQRFARELHSFMEV